jgi:S1-C subfamily serine protease
MVENNLSLSISLKRTAFLSLCFLTITSLILGGAFQPAHISFAQNQTSYSLPELYNTLGKSVVQIDVYDSKLGPLGLGSGFVYDTNGNIITNKHVALMPTISTLSYDVTFSDGKVYSARFIGADAFSDLAVLRVDNSTGTNFVPLRLGNSSLVKPGEQIAVYGSAKGLIGTLTSGVVSAVGRSSSGLQGISGTERSIFTGMPSLGISFDQPEFIQTDAAINGGNSGGPAVNMKGEVIGVSDLGLVGVGVESLAFLVPSNTVQRIIPTLISEGVYRHPWIGVEGVDMTSSIAKILKLQEPKGFLVVNVGEDSPASKAGVLGGDRPTSVPREGRSISLGGDIIVAVDDKDVRNLHDLLVYLESKKVGESVELSVIRDGSPQQISVVLGQRPGLDEFS